jgi:hypothetical protein
MSRHPTARGNGAVGAGTGLAGASAVMIRRLCQKCAFLIRHRGGSGPCWVRDGQQMVDTMPDYRIFEINKLGRIKGPAQLITCENDEEAMQTAKPLVDGYGVELWQGVRPVTRLQSKAS